MLLIRNVCLLLIVIGNNIKFKVNDWLVFFKKRKLRIVGVKLPKEKNITTKRGKRY